MAQALLAHKIPNARVESAGISAVVGEGADPHSISVMDELGLDIRAHRARQVDSDMLAIAELVLVMTEDQKIHLEARYPWVRGRVFRLGHWDNFDIDDPIHQERTAFMQARTMIAQAVESWKRRL